MLELILEILWRSFFEAIFDFAVEFLGSSFCAVISEAFDPSGLRTHSWPALVTHSWALW